MFSKFYISIFSFYSSIFSFRCSASWFSYTVSPLYMSIQVANFQRCEFVFHQLQVWGKSWLALHLLLLMILSSTISHLFSLLQAVTLLACSLDASPVCQLLCCTTVVFKIVCFKIKNAFFIFFICFLCYLCKKYCKHITYCTICLLILTDYVCWLSACSVMPNSLQPYGL